MSAVGFRVGNVSGSDDLQIPLPDPSVVTPCSISHAPSVLSKVSPFTATTLPPRWSISSPTKLGSPPRPMGLLT